jgi:catechol 2,3-dioxygenase-like lactoylglutathione lyase family enzyme
MVTSLGHVGIICDDFLKMRDFYTRVLGLTVTDESPERSSCFLSGDPKTEHHQLALGQVTEARPKTQGVGQISF